MAPSSTLVVVFAALLAGSSLAQAAPRQAQDFPHCEVPTEGSAAGTIESVREVPIARDLHAFDPGVLEHNVRPDMGEEVIIRLDGGPVITFTQAQVQRLQAGQRVRVILSGSSARVEVVFEQCSSSFA
jgi:outer membrane lipoprotein SlyB